MEVPVREPSQDDECLGPLRRDGGRERPASLTGVVRGLDPHPSCPVHSVGSDRIFIGTSGRRRVLAAPVRPDVVLGRSSPPLSWSGGRGTGRGSRAGGRFTGRGTLRRKQGHRTWSSGRRVAVAHLTPGPPARGGTGVASGRRPRGASRTGEPRAATQADKRGAGPAVQRAPAHPASRPGPAPPRPSPPWTRCPTPQWALARPRAPSSRTLPPRGRPEPGSRRGGGRGGPEVGVGRRRRGCGRTTRGGARIGDLDPATPVRPASRRRRPTRPAPELEKEPVPDRRGVVRPPAPLRRLP